MASRGAGGVEDHSGDSWRQPLRNKLTILQAIRELQQENRTINQSTVAARSGFDRATVRRHFPNLMEIVRILSGGDQLAVLTACIEARAVDEPSLCMAVHAFADTIRAVERAPEMDLFLKESAEFLILSPDAPAIVLHFFMVNWFEPLSALLARRHGRSEADPYDRMATEQIFVLSRRVLDEWRREQYKRSLSEVTVDLIGQLGHHEADGSCLFAPPPV